MGLRFAGALYTSFLPPSSMPKPRKPLALVPGSTIAVVAPASSAKEERIQRGCETLERLDYRVKRYASKTQAGRIFFRAARGAAQTLQDALTRPEIRAVLCSRGGYGSAEILDGLETARLKQAKIFCAFSDLTSVQFFCGRSFAGSRFTARWWPADLTRARMPRAASIRTHSCAR